MRKSFIGRSKGSKTQPSLLKVSSSHVKLPNPFDAKFVRNKNSVLGKSQSQFTIGKPGAAKRNMIEKRTKTILEEFRGTKRGGHFEDNRLGESDAKLPIEEKMFMRYAAERKKNFEANSRKPLGGRTEELTLRPYQSRRSENIYGGMDERTVAEIHFGHGGGDDAHRDWRDRLDQLISESKKAKYEKHAERFETLDKVDELDEDWASLRGAIFAAGAPLPPEPPKTTPSNDPGDLFDRAVRELRFESVPDNHKLIAAQQESVALEKKRRRYEEETVAHMNVLDPMKDGALPLHISADALDEDIIILAKQAAQKRKTSSRKLSASHEGSASSCKIRSVRTDLSLANIDSLSILQALQDMCNRYNPELHRDNREQFLTHFIAYLKHIFDVNSDKKDSGSSILVEQLDEAILLIFDLSKTYSSFVAHALHGIMSSYLRLNGCHSTEKLTRCYALLKLISALFPTSDAFHPVTTPAFSLLAATLRSLASYLASSLSELDTSIGICFSLAFVDLSIGYVSRSRRFIPEVLINFVETLRSLNSLKKRGHFLLGQSCIFSLSYQEALDKALLISNTICNLWAEIPGSRVFFRGIVASLLEMDSSDKIKDVLNSFEQSISKPLVPLKSKVLVSADFVELPSFAPAITSVNDDRKKQKKETVTAQNIRLKRQVRKEYRHAVRELRRDNEFLARHSLTERIANDEERERKTKRIIGQLAMQEGECRKFRK